MTTTQRWRPVVGFEEFYEVSDAGQIRSLARSVRAAYESRRNVPGRVLKPHQDARGYLNVILTDGTVRKFKPVHLLVLEAFAGPRPEGMVGCHGPGGQQDNRLSNLRWDTQSNNIRDQLRHGTHPSGATEDTCGRGHEYTPENTYWHRGCRTCDADATRERRKKHGTVAGLV